MWERAQAFITRAGTLIFCTAVLVWAAGYFPGDHTRVHELTRAIEQREQGLPEEAEEDADLQAMRAETRQLNAS